MKKQIITTVLIAILLLITSYSPVFATLQSYSPATSPYNIRDRYDTDLFTGSATYSYPIKVPKGTDDLTPDVAFSYNSTGARDAYQRTGIGWQLNQDYVERDVNFTPSSTGDDKFKLHFKGGVYDLIYVSADSRYHTKTESNLNIQKLTGGSNDYGDYWQVITPDGTKYRFGYASQSELVCNGRSYTTSWNLDQVTDVHDNKIYYTYTESNGAAYLSEIKYNNDQSRIIDFTYATSPYQRQIYPQGCNVTESSRLSNIQVKLGTNLIHQYDLNYTTAGNSQSLLQSITEKGSDGSSLPATTFDYKPEVKTWQTQGTKWLDHADIDTHLNMTATAIADVNGDGLADIVRTLQVQGGATWKVLLNQGGSWSSSFQTWVSSPISDDARLDRSDVRLIDVTGDNLPDIVMAASAGSWKVWRNTGSSWNTQSETWGDLGPYGSENYLGDGRIALVDVTGDGLPDVVAGLSNSWRVFRNMGDKWNGAPETWNTNISQALNDPSIRIADVNGDGLPDIVRVTHSGTNASWYVWKNNGNGWNSSSETWINNANIDAYFENNDTTLVDVNGDGLADIVRSFDGGLSDQWKVLLNQGNSWSTTYETWIPSSANLDLDAHSDTVRMADVTGDGLTDIVKGQADCSCSYDTWTVWKNNGLSPDLLSAVHTAQGGTINFNYAQSVSPNTDTVSSASYTGEYFNNQTLSGTPALTRTDSAINFDWGTGSPDSSISSDHFSVRWTQTRSFSAGSYIFNTRTDDGVRLYVDGELILDKWVDQSPTNYTASKSLTDGNHTIVMEYYENGAGATAKLSYQKISLPFPLWQVSQMTTDNGMTNSQNTNDVTTYSYKNPFYKFEDREFRGFGEINTVEPNGSKKKYIFNQDNAAKGRLAEMQYRDSSSNPFTETEDTWSNSLSNGIYTVNLASEKNYTYDATASGAKVIQTNYQYDSYGNITKKSELGDTSTNTDDRFTYNEYTTNTTAWILNTIKHSYINAANDSTKVAENWFYYDGNTSVDTSPTKGDLTKDIKWLDTSGGTNPVTQYAYDTYGNQTSVTDANNHTTATAYDTATHTYPTSTTNAKNQTTTISYDLGTGNLLSQTDPNNNTTSYNYDVFGRVTKEIKPYDSSSNPTTAYQYFNDGVSPEGTLISKRETASSSATLDAYTWSDGLGRTLQTRTEAENPANQIVTDMFYDQTGQVNKVTVPHTDTLVASYSAPLTGIKNTQTSYDPIGRVSIITNPKGDNKTIAYDHWKQTTIDENGHIKREYKNAYDKITKVDEVISGATVSTNYTYDTLNNLIKITDAPGNETTFTYDSLGRKKSQTDPDMGTWAYTYDGVGNLLTQKDNRNITITKTYDELDRLTKTDYPTDTDTTFSYDLGKIGTLSIATDSAGTINYTYDNRLRKTQEQRLINGTTKTTQFSYDAANRLVTQTNPDGEVVTYAFNPQGEINSMTGSSAIINNIDYNALGKITKKDFANGITTNYTYNTNDFRLNRIQTGTLQDMGYTYDNVGNVSSITDNTTNKTQNFTYDDLDRLKTASESAGQYNYAYTYNSIGNITAFNDAGTTTNYLYGQNAGVHAMTSSTTTSPVKTAAFTEDWESGSINDTKWNDWSNSQASIVNNQLKITSTLSSDYYGIDSGIGSFTQDLTNSSVSNQLVDAGNQSLTHWDVLPVVVLKPGGNWDNQLLFVVSNNTVIAKKEIAGTFTDLHSAAYNSAVHKYFRIRESGGTTYFDTSADGQSWTNFTSVANPFDITQVITGMTVGTWQAESTTTSATFDNFNTRPVTPSASSFSDNWSSGNISTQWSNWSSGHASVSNTQLNISSLLAGGYFGLDSGADGKIYDLTGSFAQNQLVNPGNLNLSSWEVYPVSIFKASDTNYALHFFVTGTTLVARTSSPSGFTNIRTATFNSSTQKYFRIKESHGTIYWDTSTDGQTWTNFTSAANPFDMTAVRVGMMAGTWHSESSTTTATFDNFNIWSPPTASMTDDWSSGYMEPTKWNNWGGSNVQVTNQQLVMTSTTASNYFGLDQADGKTYNLTNSSITNQLINAGNQSITSWEVYPVFAFPAGDDSNAYFWQVSGNTIRAYKKVAGTYTQLSSAAYNTTNHKWFRIKESAGTIYFDTSADGTTWTTLTSTTNAFTITSMTASSLIGTWQNETATTAATFDNFNTPPANYTYDANGNMTSDGTTCYHYNEANQMDKVTNCSNTQTTAEYVYDYNGNRMVKKNYTNGTLTNTVTSWSDAFETKVIVNGPTENTSYYFANGQLIAKKNPDGTKYYFHNDHLGSTSIITNQAGTLVEETKYDPWGEVKSGGTKSKFLYTGQEKDSETNLNYYGARYYDSHIRRFTQADDIIQDVYSPQSLNRYSYAWNNPLRYTDPTGHAIVFQNGMLYSNLLTPNPQPTKKTPTTVAEVLSAATKAKSTPTTQLNTNKTVGSALQSSTNNQPSYTPNILDIKKNIQETANHKIITSNWIINPQLNIYNMLWYANMEREGGEWDYKHSCGKGCENFGNFNYGATARAANYWPEVIGRMGGVVQQLTNEGHRALGQNEQIVKTKSMPLGAYPYGDSFEKGRSIDQEMIKAGMAYYDSPW